MEGHFTADTEARLQQLAALKGKDTSEIVEETINQMLERRARFLKGVELGIAAANQGNLIDHEEVVNRIERLLQL